jgi:hypothetical protein
MLPRFRHFSVLESALRALLNWTRERIVRFFYSFVTCSTVSESSYAIAFLSRENNLMKV